MTNERHIISLRGWIYDKINSAASNYHRYLNINNRIQSTDWHNGMIPEDHIQVFVEEVLNESEKAVQVILATGEIDGPSDGWKCWIPKSAMEVIR